MYSTFIHPEKDGFIRIELFDQDDHLLGLAAVVNVASMETFYPSELWKDVFQVREAVKGVLEGIMGGLVKVVGEGESRNRVKIEEKGYYAMLLPAGYDKNNPLSMKIHLSKSFTEEESKNLWAYSIKDPYTPTNSPTPSSKEHEEEVIRVPLPDEIKYDGPCIRTNLDEMTQSALPDVKSSNPNDGGVGGVLGGEGSIFGEKTNEDSFELANKIYRGWAAKERLEKDFTKTTVKEFQELLYRSWDFQNAHKIELRGDNVCMFQYDENNFGFDLNYTLDGNNKWSFLSIRTMRQLALCELCVIRTTDEGVYYRYDDEIKFYEWRYYAIPTFDAKRWVSFYLVNFVGL